MAKFPRDAPKKRVIKTLESLGFSVVREKEHVAMVRENDDGSGDSLDDAEPSPHQRVDTENHLHTDQDLPRGFFESISKNMMDAPVGEQRDRALPGGHAQ